MVSPVFIRPVLAILVMTAIIGIVAVISRNGSHGTPPVRSALQQLPRNIDIALKKARFSEMHDGSVVWVLDAERVQYDKGGEMAYLTDVRLNVTRSRGGGSVLVRADSCNYQTGSKDIHLRGNVHIQTDDGATFDTDKLEYQASRAHFITAVPVTFHQQRISLQALGMVLGLNDQRARFTGPIAANIVAVVR